MMKRVRRLRLIGLAALLLGQSATAMADVMILRSAGPSARRYPAGQRLPDNATLVLRSGDSVTILRRAGTRIFRGPGSFGLNSAPVRSRRSEGTSRGIRSEIAATRGGPDANTSLPPDVWLIDALVSQRGCFRSGMPVDLWRAGADAALEVTVASGGQTTRLNWPAGRQTLRLPASIAVDGAVVETTRPGATRPIRITLSAITVDAANREAVAAALIGRGCRNQIDTFAALNDEEASQDPFR